MSNIKYEETLKKEVLREYCAAIKGAIFRNGSTAEHSTDSALAEIKKELWRLGEELYGATMERLLEIENRLHILKKQVAEVYPDAII